MSSPAPAFSRDENRVVYALAWLPFGSQLRPASVVVVPLLNASGWSHGYSHPGLRDVVLQKGPIGHRSSFAVAHRPSATRHRLAGKPSRTKCKWRGGDARIG